MPSPLPSDMPLPPGFPLPTLMGQPELPLQGLTVLAVEDSRFACEALRLMCQRAGARMRRADSLAAARAHLRVYRPDVVLVDLGLPDGRGEALIRDLVMSQRRPRLVLGTSGHPQGRAAALAAGADGFLDKPLESLHDFCVTLRRLLPGLDLGFIPDARISPDPLALQDDLASAAAALSANPDPARQRYVSGFLLGLAQHAHDPALARAATDTGDSGLQSLRSLINARLCEAGTAFARKP